MPNTQSTDPRSGAERLLAAQIQVLEMIASDAPLPETLDFVARLIESLSDDIYCSVLILDGQRLRHGAGPSLPAEYVQAIDGVEIGPRVGSCGTAAFTGETVIVEDIAVDPLWQGYRGLALEHGLRACWSTPIFSSRGTVLGTFAMYHPSPGPPRESDRKLVLIATHLTAIALERHGTRKALERQAAELAYANQAKDRFFAMVSHELRNPLAPLLLAVELVRHSNFEPAKVERCCAIVERQARQLARLIDDLLDVARITSGKVELNKELVSVASLIDMAREASALIEQYQHELVVSLPSEPLEVHVDPGRMVQVLTNLLNNSAKYMDPGGRVTIRAWQDGAEIVIEVADTGHGIDPDHLSEMFEPFVQAEGSQARSHGGFGVGLAVARSLVELHGGRIVADSAGLGQGCQVTVRLPAFTGERPSRPSPPLLATPNRRRRVLVVDDNVDAAEIVGEAVDMVGHEVRVVHDGLAALVAVEGWIPDVVILDIGLPGIDGYEVASRIRSTHPNAGIRIIAVSGFGRPPDCARSEATGIDEHFVKPVDLETLVRAIEGA